MKDRIITISRQYGSGGRQIGRKLAQELGIPFYDKEVIDLAAKESGLAVDFIRGQEQQLTQSLRPGLSGRGQGHPGSGRQGELCHRGPVRRLGAGKEL